MEIPTAATITAAVDHDDAREWLRRAVQTESVTGREEGFAQLVAETLRSCADEVGVLPVAAGRPLVWSRTKGRASDRPVMLAAHLDTVAPSGPPPAPGIDDGSPFAGHVIDGQLWGLGAADDKGGIAAALAALHALRRLGLRPAQDVITLWVPDEESGVSGTGKSAGMRRAVELIADGTIPLPAFAVYLEPTSLNVYSAQVGFLIGEIQITGRAAYWAQPQRGIDAQEIAEKIAAELRAYHGRLRERARHPLLDSPVLTITGCTSGGTVAVPGRASLSFIRSLDPGENLDLVAAELQALVGLAVAGTGASASVEFPDGRDHSLGGRAAFTDPNHPTVRALSAALRAVAPGTGNLGGADFWSETSFLEELGIASVYCGPGDIHDCHTKYERVDLAEIETLSAALALFLAEITER